MSTFPNESISVESSLACVEAEFIKNLQQQIYYLELEANFLREQTKKSIILQPKVESEAETMSRKLRELHCQADGLHLELKRKDAYLNTLQTEKERLSKQFKQSDDSHSKEKQSLVEEIIQLKKMKEFTDRELSHKEAEILQRKQELDRQISDLKNTDHKVIMLNEQERIVKEETDLCRTSSVVQLITVKDHKQQLEYELKRHKELLEIKKNKFKELMEKILLLEQGKTSLELNKDTLHSRIAEMQSRIANIEEESLQLQRDKVLLIDLITDLQKQFSSKEEELSRVYSEIHLIDEDISTLRSRNALEQSVQSEKWQELSRVSGLAKLTGSISRNDRKYVQ